MGEIVNHITFGRGKIVQESEGHIRVEFDNTDVGEKLFVYPGAFAKFLSYEDDSLQKKVKRKLTALNRKIAAEQKKLEEQRAEALLSEKRQALYVAAAKKRAHEKAAASH